uniref:Uncharacterized protein n=1 Tax=Oryza punctata TaxID=4537 RepID=A0A0E0L8Z5_ORYPU
MSFAMRCSPESTFLRMLPVLHDIHDLTPSKLSKLVASQPDIILLGPDCVGEIVHAIQNAGVKPGSPMFVYIFVSFSKLKALALENKFAIYRSLGFDKDDITVMLRRFPNEAWMVWLSLASRLLRPRRCQAPWPRQARVITASREKGER